MVGTAILAGVGGLALVTTLRRPSLAEDSDSLLVDDVLRADDARNTVAPYPIAIALVTGLSSTVDSWVLWPFLGYAAVALILWIPAERAARRMLVRR